MLLLQNALFKSSRMVVRMLLIGCFMSGIFEDHINKTIKNKSKSSTLTVRTGPTVKSSNFLLSARFFILDISEVLDQFCKRTTIRLLRLMKGNWLVTSYKVLFTML